MDKVAALVHHGRELLINHDKAQGRPAEAAGFHRMSKHFDFQPGACLHLRDLNMRRTRVWFTTAPSSRSSLVLRAPGYRRSALPFVPTE